LTYNHAGLINLSDEPEKRQLIAQWPMEEKRALRKEKSKDWE
jgi:hypothetical protein